MNMRKLLALVLSLTMAFVLAAPALADSVDYDGYDFYYDDEYAPALEDEYVEYDYYQGDDEDDAAKQVALNAAAAPTPITGGALMVTEPVTGAIPQTSTQINTETNSSQFTVTGAAWQWWSGVQIGFFPPGREPVLRLTLTARQGFTFSGLAAGSTVFTVAGATSVVNTTGSATITVTVTFPTTSTQHSAFTFVGNGGTPETTVIIITPPSTTTLGSVAPVVTRPGYRFAGWWTDPRLGRGVPRGENFVLHGAAAVYAHWIPAPPPDFLPGDVNGDGRVTGIDVLLLRLYLAGFPVNINLAAADVNRDGRVTGIDVLLIRLYLAGFPVTLG